jgi:hypothetical protein
LAGAQPDEPVEAGDEGPRAETERRPDEQEERCSPENGAFPQRPVENQEMAPNAR